MSDFQVVENKLQQFIKKFYINELIRGAILYLAAGVFYFLLVSGIEYFLWLPSTGRAVLFWLFVGAELLLCFIFLIRPLLRLLKLQKGLTPKAAATIIGRHFKEVDDKLINTLELQEQADGSSELLLASIEQKASEIKAVSFRRAIDYTKNLRYTKYIIIPFLSILLIGVFGDLLTFLEGYQRVSHYTQVYTPPAPYQFIVTNNSLAVRDTEVFRLKVQTIGSSTPEEVEIHFNNQQYVLTPRGTGLFEFEFEPQTKSLQFQIKTETVSSELFTLEVLKTPMLTSFSMGMRYPKHTQLRHEVLQNEGNARVVQGTLIDWRILARNTSVIGFVSQADTVLFDNQNNDTYTLSSTSQSSFRYQIIPENQSVGRFEPLTYQIEVYRDEPPTLEIERIVDSINTQVMHHRLLVSDDFGLRELSVVCFTAEDLSDTRRYAVPIGRGLVQQVFYDFPTGFELAPGQNYQYYFEAIDNDQPNGFKVTRSQVFGVRTNTTTEQRAEVLGRQQEQLLGLDQVLRQIREQEAQNKSIQNQQSQTESVDWQQKMAAAEMLNREQKTNDRIRKATDQIKKTLDQVKELDSGSDPYEEALQERLEEQQRSIQENEQRLKELQELQKKINEEEFKEDLDKLAQRQKNQKKSLEQLVEQTRRYYVAKKTQQIAEALQELGERQIEAAERNHETKEDQLEEQNQLNSSFQKLQEQMEQLQKENEQLTQPMQVPRDKFEEDQISNEQNSAAEKINQEDQEGAKSSQKKAGQKMKEMGSKMGAQMQMMQMDSVQEDAEMLREILDNLIVFSTEQESLMEQMISEGPSSVQFGKRINRQNTLKENFKHIDDSLFALSLRQPLMGASINKHISDGQFYLDKSLDDFADNKLSQASGSQQYVFANANALAELLDAVLAQMEQMAMNMPGSGSGQGQSGQGFQLSDIIKKQESLQQEMEQGLSPGEGMPKPGQGQKGQEGQEQGSGEEGKTGEGGQEGSGAKGNTDSGQQSGDDKGDGGLEQNYSEEMNGQLFEIYKQQQQLRQALENKLRALGLSQDQNRLLEQLERVEQKILDNGYNRETIDQMRQIKHELLKLQDAELKQGEEESREARSNKTNHDPLKGEEIDSPKNYFQQLEILNKEALPLQPYFKNEVQRYFKKDNDRV